MKLLRFRLQQPPKRLPCNLLADWDLPLLDFFLVLYAQLRAHHDVIKHLYYHD